MPSARQHIRFTKEDLQDQFRAFSREPFQEVLADLVEGAPTPKAIQAFADQHPDKWANAVRVMSNLAGYHDKLEITGNISIEISNMGDAQLMERLEQLSSEILELGPEEFAETKALLEADQEPVPVLDTPEE